MIPVSVILPKWWHDIPNVWELPTMTDEEEFEDEVDNDEEDVLEFEEELEQGWSPEESE